MRPELQRVIDQFASAREAILAINDTSLIAMNGWTVAQVLDHLARVHEKMLPLFQEALASAPARFGDDTIRPTFLERQMIRGMSGGLPFKIPVPPMFEPGPAGPEAKAACLASIDRLLAMIPEADGKALAGLKVTSPVSQRIHLGWLPYLEALAAHALYHKGQI